MAMTSIRTVVISIRQDSAYRRNILDRISCVLGSEQLLIEINSENDIEEKLRDLGSRAILINFDNGVIIPKQFLELFDGNAYNFHSAPPEYPGRDVHHFAVYDGAQVFGATLHIMSEKVDAGPILRVRRCRVAPDDSPQAVAKKGLESAYEIFLETFEEILKGGSLGELQSENWEKKPKGTRNKMLQMCRLTSELTSEEVSRRIKSFDHPEYTNLFVELHGFKFFYMGEKNERAE